MDDVIIFGYLSISLTIFILNIIALSLILDCSRIVKFSIFFKIFKNFTLVVSKAYYILFVCFDNIFIFFYGA